MSEQKASRTPRKRHSDRARVKSGYPIRRVTTPGGDERFQVVMITSPSGAAQRRQVRRNFSDLDAALSFVDDTRKQIRDGSYLGRDGTTVRQLADDWLSSKAKARPSTVDGYRGDLMAFLRVYGDRPAQRVTARSLQDYVNTLPKTGGVRGSGLSPRSVSVTLQRIRQVFAHGVKLGLLRTSPAQYLEAPAMSEEDETRIAARKFDSTVWSFAQLRHFVAAADEDKYAVGWRLSALGLRRSEVLGLDWGAVDLDAEVIHVVRARASKQLDRVKSKASRRTVPLSMLPGTTALLKQAWLAAGRPRTNTVTIDKQGKPVGGQKSSLVVLDASGQPVDRDIYSRRFTRVCHEAGLPRCRLHSLRHCIASELHDRGVAPATAAALLGHETTTHTMIYVGSSADRQNAAAEVFGKAWSAAG